MGGGGILGVELTRVGAGETEDVAGELDRHDLHPQAQAQTRDAVLPGVAGRCDLALHTPLAEAARQHDAVEPGHRLGHQQTLDVVGHDPGDLEIHLMIERCMTKRLGHRQVGVGQADILADETDPQRFPGVLDPLHQVLPLGQIGLALVDPEESTDVGVETGVMHHQRDLVEA